MAPIRYQLTHSSFKCKRVEGIISPRECVCVCVCGERERLAPKVSSSGSTSHAKVISAKKVTTTNPLGAHGIRCTCFPPIAFTLGTIHEM